MSFNLIKSDDKGRTPLHMAAAQGRHDLVKVLLDEDGDGVMARDCNGNTPLHYCGHVDTIRCLVAYGADLVARNKNGDTPLDLMIRRGVKKEAIRLVEELISAAEDDFTEKPWLHGQRCLPNNLCEPSIWSEFCSDIGLKRLMIVLVFTLCLSFYVAYVTTGMSKPNEQRIPINEVITQFEL